MEFYSFNARFKQIQLTQAGLQPFQGSDTTISYHHMCEEQQAFLQDLLKKERSWMVKDQCMVYTRERGARRLNVSQVAVLEAVCKQV